MIISAYRRLVSVHHPDRVHGASESAQTEAAAKFIEITRAYETLMAIYRD
jgi:DnaJ-class molecular chaperone